MQIVPIILVTGAGGQLGKELQDISAAFPGYKFIFKGREELAIDQPGAIERIFEELSPEYCINAAAYTAVDNAENPDQQENVFSINADGVHHLATQCDKYGTKFIQVSTDYVFNGRTREPYREEDETDPLNIYGESKLKGEEFALSYPCSIVLRTSWVYSSYGKNFVKTMIRLMKEKKEISVVNDQWGSPTYAADIAVAILKMIEFPDWQPGLYHFTNKGVITWFEFAGMIREMTGSECIVHPISTEQYPTAAARPAWSVLDTTKISRVFGIQPRNWQDALGDCLARMKEQGAW